ncbi:MAG: hypothetical protein R2707_19065 [Acidimicrobiales bacterium]
MRVLRWWFENRETGAITVAQFPNWPLFGVGSAWLVGWIASDGSRLHDIAGVAATGLWLYWGADELVRGVNPWRRLLGSTAIAWQLGGLVR